MSLDPYALSTEEGDALLAIARHAVVRAASGESEGGPPEHPTSLDVEGASFVTVYVGEELNGCLGSLIPTRSIAEDVAHNAYSAAIGDPRFAPLSASQLDSVHIHVSVLSSLSPLNVSSFEELIAELRPNVDGLLIRHGHRRGTFLPSVWEKLESTEEFLHHLWLKAGLLPGVWTEGLEVYRYTTRQFEAQFSATSSVSCSVNR